METNLNNALCKLGTRFEINLGRRTTTGWRDPVSRRHFNSLRSSSHYLPEFQLEIMSTREVNK